jgi:hypothetical protein
MRFLILYVVGVGDVVGPVPLNCGGAAPCM